MLRLLAFGPTKAIQVNARHCDRKTELAATPCCNATPQAEIRRLARWLATFPHSRSWAQAIIDGNGKGTVITVPRLSSHPENGVLITDLTIMRGYGTDSSPGGGIQAYAPLNVRHSILVNNYSVIDGGRNQLRRR